MQWQNISNEQKDKSDKSEKRAFNFTHIIFHFIIGVQCKYMQQYVWAYVFVRERIYTIVPMTHTRTVDILWRVYAHTRMIYVWWRMERLRTHQIKRWVKIITHTHTYKRTQRTEVVWNESSAFSEIIARDISVLIILLMASMPFCHLPPPPEPSKFIFASLKMMNDVQVIHFGPCPVLSFNSIKIAIHHANYPHFKLTNT